MADRFPWKDMADANAECARRDCVDFTNCPNCKLRIGLHCLDCKIQVTGCLCTEIDRFGEDETWKRAVERFGAELARQHYARAGLFVPKGVME